MYFGLILEVRLKNSVISPYQERISIPGLRHAVILPRILRLWGDRAAVEMKVFRERRHRIGYQTAKVGRWLHVSLAKPALLELVCEIMANSMPIIPELCGNTCRYSKKKWLIGYLLAVRFPLATIGVSYPETAVICLCPELWHLSYPAWVVTPGRVSSGQYIYLRWHDFWLRR